MSALIGKKLGQLEVVEQIGQGGMATVYKAYQPALDRFVAIKVLPATYAKDPTFMERFIREARAIAKLYHPHILPVHDFGDQDGTTYIVMEYVSGGTLKRRLKPGQPMPLRDAIDAVLQTCQALECAHQHNIVHRDIKPGNMLLRSDNFLLLSDFGIAKILEANTALTRTGVGIGTPQYMSPEQSTGSPNVGPRSDLYSLGIVLYQACQRAAAAAAPVCA
jgi:eukaryotic-like serine/threonine-protein kinase